MLIAGKEFISWADSPPQALPQLAAGAFMRAFHAKGRFVDRLGATPSMS